MTITALPTPPSRSSPSTFATLADAFLGALPTFVAEANALAAALNSISAGAAVGIPYTFSTTTADADPGDGYLRLDNATQNTATTIRADLKGSDGSTWTDVLATFDDSDSTIKGHILLQKLGDGTKWILFTISALASPAGYKNISVAVVAASSANPFSNADAIILKFTRTGDKGETGGVPGDHAITVHTGNGHGSTNTCIRKFTTTLLSVGTAITYATSAENGASFTINATGIYEIYYSEDTNNGEFFGASVNSAALTTGISVISIATRLMMIRLPSEGFTKAVTRTVKLTAGDIVRPHTNGNASGTSNNSFFAIRKVGVIS